MQTIIVLISKISNDGIIYWIESNRKISSKLIDELNNDPDTILLVNPINEWQEFKFEKLTVVNYLPGVTDNSALVFKDLLNLYHEKQKFYRCIQGIFILIKI